MIVAGVFLASSIAFVVFQRKSTSLGALYFVFGFFIGAFVLLVGFLMRKWENRWVGRSGDEPDISRTLQRTTFGDRHGVVMPPHDLVGIDPETGIKLCQFFFLDEENRLPCLEGCKYPDGGHAACTFEKVIPTCPYPKSRQPIVKSRMPRPVAWCPGPGGCAHFDERDRTCGLKRKGIPHESLYLLDRTTQNRTIGSVIIFAGILVGLASVAIFAPRGIGVLVAGGVLLGFFFGWVGVLVINHAKTE